MGGKGAFSDGTLTLNKATGDISIGGFPTEDAISPYVNVLKLGDKHYFRFGGSTASSSYNYIYEVERITRNCSLVLKQSEDYLFRDLVDDTFSLNTLITQIRPSYQVNVRTNSKDNWTAGLNTYDSMENIVKNTIIGWDKLPDCKFNVRYGFCSYDPDNRKLYSAPNGLRGVTIQVTIANHNISNTELIEYPGGVSEYIGRETNPNEGTGGYWICAIARSISFIVDTEYSYPVSIN